MFFSKRHKRGCHPGLLNLLGHLPGSYINKILWSIALTGCIEKGNDIRTVSILLSRSISDTATEQVYIVQKYVANSPYENLDTITFPKGVTELTRTYDEPFLGMMALLDSGVSAIASPNFIASFEPVRIVIKKGRAENVVSGENDFFRSNRFLFHVPSGLQRRGFDYRLLRSEFNAADRLSGALKNDYQRYEQSILQVVGNMPNSFYVLFALNMNRHNMSLATLEACLMKFSPDIKKTGLWADLSKYVHLSKMNLIGESIRHFQVINTDYRPVSSEEVFSGKKYYYVDFWASWCLPCRRGIADLKSVISQVDTTKVKFVFLSVDNDPAKWKVAVEEDNASGCHLLDSVGQSGLMKSMFALDFIPQNFLVNERAEIVRKNLSPREVKDFFASAHLLKHSTASGRSTFMNSSIFRHSTD